MLTSALAASSRTSISAVPTGSPGAAASSVYSVPPPPPVTCNAPVALTRSGTASPSMAVNVVRLSSRIAPAIVTFELASVKAASSAKTGSSINCKAVRASPSTCTAKVPALSTVKLPALSSTEITPVESFARVTRKAEASTPPPVTDSAALSTVRLPALSSTEITPVLSLEMVTRCVPASVAPLPVLIAVPPNWTVLVGKLVASTSSIDILRLPAAVDCTGMKSPEPAAWAINAALTT